MFGLRGLLKVSPWRRWTVSSFLCRFPQPMSLLAFQLVGLRVTGSLGKGALLVGLTSFCGVLGPWAGRRRDRQSMRRQLQLSCLLATAALVGMALCVQFRTPFAYVVVCAVVQGSALAGTWSGFRALLVVVVDPEHVHQAHFLESLMVEVGYGLGPLAVSLIILVANVTDVLLVMAAIELAGVIALRWVPDLDGKDVPRIKRSGSHFPRKQIFVICGLGFLLSLGFALIESNVPARMHQYGLPASRAGLFMALLATGSCIGGIVVSIRPLRHSRPMLQAAVLFGLFGLLSIPSALAGSTWVFLAVLPFNSLMLVPLNGLGAAEVEHRVGLRGRGEAFGYFNAATRLGSGFGATINGVLLSVIAAAQIPLLASGIFLAIPLVLLVAAAIFKGTRDELTVPVPLGVGVPETEDA